jgi:hypothetical protein
VASYVWTLSGGCLSAEVECWLLWELPLKRGWSYWHSALLANGTKTVSSSDTVLTKNQQFEQMVLERMRK